MNEKQCGVEWLALLLNWDFQEKLSESPVSMDMSWKLNSVSVFTNSSEASNLCFRCRAICFCLKYIPIKIQRWKLCSPWGLLNKYVYFYGIGNIYMNIYHIDIPKLFASSPMTYSYFCSGCRSSAFHGMIHRQVNWASCEATGRRILGFFRCFGENAAVVSPCEKQTAWLWGLKQN